MTHPTSDLPSHLLPRATRLAGLLAAGLLAACGVDQPAGPPGRHEATLVDQLARADQALATNGLALHIVGYTPAAALDSEDAVRAVKAELVAASAIVPQFDGVDPSSLVLNTIGERTAAFVAGRDPQDVITNIETMALPAVKLGQRAMDVTWDHAGRELHTKLVYDDQGIVYDNLLSNLAFVEAREVVADEAPHPPQVANLTGGVISNVNKSFSVRFINFDITWVWGGQRGQVQLDHFVISCDGWKTFCDDGGAANAWMTLGSADGKTRRHSLTKPRISKLAWAYGWATPTASFSISWNPGNLSFSASTSGVGSAGKGAGIHAII